MKQGWPEVPLGDVIDIFDHLRVPLNATQRAARQGPFPYYGAQGVIDHVDGYLFDGRYLLIPEDGENLNSRKLPIAYFASGRFWVNNHAHIVRGKRGVADDVFVKQWLNNADISPFVTGAAQPKLSQGNLRRIPVRLPPLAIQLRIASILGAYDDLIEVNRRRIAVLEEMARRLFEDWFVTRNLSGHAERIGDATPWRRASVGEAVRFVRGRSYRSADLADSGGLPFVNLKCMLRDGGFRRDGLKRYVGEYKDEHILRTGDIVVAVTDMTQDRRIVGQAARIPRSDEPVAVMSMDLVKVVPSQSLLPLFCYYWLRHSGFAAVAAQHANGANVLHLSPSAMAGLPIEIPPIALQRAFCELAQPLTDAAEVIGLSNERLATSRDLLLPRLISGDLPVAAAERELEAVA